LLSYYALIRLRMRLQAFKRPPKSLASEMFPGSSGNGLPGREDYNQTSN